MDALSIPTVRALFDRLLVVEIATAVTVLLVLFLLVRILRAHYAPSSTLAWVIAIVLVPFVAVPLYLFFGARRMRKLHRRKRTLYPLRPEHETETWPALREHPSLQGIVSILQAADMPPPSPGNEVRFLADGVRAFDELIGMIRAAEESVFVEAFLLGRDHVGQAIVDELAARAQKGVDVRLLLDGIGCGLTKGRFTDPIRKAGGRVGVFNPVWPPRLAGTFHLRNHRKLTIVDGRRAMIGGMNLAKQYMGPEPHPNRWADTTLVATGPTVADLVDLFGADWEYATSQELPHTPAPQPDPVGDTMLQVVASGPDAEVINLYDSLTMAMMHARERVWIATPYFVPDEGQLRLFKVLARMGRDVRIVVPRRSNHLIVDLARGAFFRDLSDTRVKMYSYQPGMLHSKLLLIDDQVALVGSANMDIRSLNLNYEAGVFVYSREFVEKIADLMQGYMAESVLLTRDKGIRRNFAAETVEDVFRLFAPLL